MGRRMIDRHMSAAEKAVEAGLARGSVDDPVDDRWPALPRATRWVLAGVVGVLSVAVVPSLPPGVCFSDAGDLQLASATLGIMHPPGYTGYTICGWLLTRLPGVDPAYMITLACFACGVGALAVGMLVQIRLGVSRWLAGAMMLALTAHPRVWTNLVAPEVYAPTLLLVLVAAYWLAKHLCTRAPAWLYWSAGVYGLAVANRPPVVWTFPFFVAAWWIGSQQQPGFPRSAARRVALATCCAALPGLFSIGYLWIRDTPTTAYNYIEMHNREVGELQPVSAGWRAKLERIWYHGTAREFSRYMENDPRRAWKRLKWIYKEFFLYEFARFVIVCVILAIGFSVALARNAPMALLVLGLVVGNVVFICTYDIYGMAADLSMLMSAAVILGGVALSSVVPTGVRGWRSVVPVVLALAAGVWTVRDVPRRYVRAETDALGFLAELEMATLPPDSVICSTWSYTPPLLFEKYMRTGRSDIEIVNATTRLWARQASAYAGRPIFAVSTAPEREEFRMTPYRNIWRAELVSTAGGDGSADDGSFGLVP